MKAKEYAHLLNENFMPERVAKVADMMLKEAADLTRSRHAQTDAAAISIFREQDQKWRAICRHVPGLKPEGFRLIVAYQFPEIAPLIKW